LLMQSFCGIISARIKVSGERRTEGENMLVYLDNSATTRQYEQVTEEMLRMVREEYGNPSSLHRMGLAAEKTVKKARESIAENFGVSSGEIYFTGSGTESDNTAFFGAAEARKRKGKRIVTSSVEHPAVLEACKKLEREGFLVDYIDVDRKGLVNMSSLEAALGQDVILVSVMAVNNELGTVQPIGAIGSLVKKKTEALFHTDAVQAFGKVRMDAAGQQLDLISCSAHKIHGPKGMGALYVKKGVQISPLLYGGGQERGFRSGTENTPGIAGFGVAAKLICENFNNRFAKMRKSRDYLLVGLQEEVPDIVINSPEKVIDSISGAGESACCASVLNVSFLGCRGEVLLHSLEQKDIFVSTGSACSSHKKGSHVLSAAGFSPAMIEGAIRFSFSEFNTIEEMDYVLFELKKAVKSMRKIIKKNK